MKKDQPGKTRNFIKKGLILWIIAIGVFLLMKLAMISFGFFKVGNSLSVFFEPLSGIVFVFLICGIPITLFLAVVLKLAEKGIDRMG